MSSFTSELQYSVLDHDQFQRDIRAGIRIDSRLYDGKHWRLDEEYDYEIGEKGSGIFIHIPKGFITDMASVPRIFWAIYPPFGLYGKAAILHDYLYSVCGTNYALGKTYTRKQCDLIFKEAMLVLNCSWHCRGVIYSGVRLGGWVTWAKYKRKLGEK
jgi:hypothetical protein